MKYNGFVTFSLFGVKQLLFLIQQVFLQCIMGVAFSPVLFIITLVLQVSSSSQCGVFEPVLEWWMRSCVIRTLDLKTDIATVRTWTVLPGLCLFYLVVFQYELHKD